MDIEPPGDAIATDLRIAAIDVGSNSVRLVVAQVLPTGGYRVLDEERENTRLAASLSVTGRLAPEAVETTVSALRHFLSIAEGYEVKRIRAIATSAVREAKNGAEFCRRVRNELNLKVDVIRSEDEARLAFLSVARAFDISGRQIAVADIGGGSTEIILSSSGLIDQIYATRLGTVRLTERCGVSGQCSNEKLSKLRRSIDRELKRELGKIPFTPMTLYGTGGTFTALASIILAQDQPSEQTIWGFRVTRARIRHLITDLAQMPLEKRRKVAGLNPQRADIIVAGLVTIERIMRYLEVNVVQVHNRGVRDGLLLTMLRDVSARVFTPAERRSAVEHFAESCGADLVHARQVARIAGSLFEQLAEPLKLDPSDQEWIESAAVLANVGYLINFDDHHKHSYHLIINSELPGFERRQLQLVANIARYHRGTRPKKKHDPYRELSETDQNRVAQLAAILRLALALDRTHQQRVEDVRAVVHERSVEITVLAKGNADVDIWAARRKVELFEKVFHREVLVAAFDPQVAKPVAELKSSEEPVPAKAAASNGRSRRPR